MSSEAHDFENISLEWYTLKIFVSVCPWSLPSGRGACRGAHVLLVLFPESGDLPVRLVSAVTG